MTVYEDLEGSNCSFDEEDEYGHEALPFALNEESTIEEMRPLHTKLLECSVNSRPVAASSTVVQSMETVPLAQSTFSQAPPLMASIMTTDSSLGSSMLSDQWGETGTGTNMISSRHLDAAASLMASMAGNGLQMSMAPVQPQQPSSSTLIQPLPNPVAPESPYSRLGFSRLLQNAGDGSEIVGAGLPVLHEEEADSFYSAREAPLSKPCSFPSNISTTTSQVMGAPPDWVPIIDEPSRGSYTPPVLDSSLQSQPQQRQPLARERVYARQLDPASFEVSIDIAPDLSMEDIMEVLGNPSYLVLWCESIRSLVVINSSEGATTPQTPQKSSQVRAGHEGQWIEASTTDLISPPSSSSCLYSTSKAVWNYVGFPSHYGNVSMFVERPQGRVGLSIGPFPGDVAVSHSIRVDPRANRIVDTVTLSRNGSSNGGDLLCGVLECLESCFLPTLRGYMDQVVDSMVRLRSLVETGEGGSQQEGFELIHAQRQRVY